MCILEVDLEYAKELYKLHNDYPLSPYSIDIKREMLSEYQLKIADLYNIPIGNVKKIVLNLFHKAKYVIHCENLQFYLRLGLNQRKSITYQNLINHNGLNIILNLTHKKEYKQNK